jgi:hypothetical protein
VTSVFENALLLVTVGKPWNRLVFLGKTRDRSSRILQSPYEREAEVVAEKW